MVPIPILLSQLKERGYAMYWWGNKKTDNVEITMPSEFTQSVAMESKCW